MKVDGFYQLGTCEGILKQLYARSQIACYPKNLLKIEDIPDHEIFLLSAATGQSTGSGHSSSECVRPSAKTQSAFVQENQ